MHIGMLENWKTIYLLNRSVERVFVSGMPHLSILRFDDP